MPRPGFHTHGVMGKIVRYINNKNNKNSKSMLIFIDKDSKEQRAIKTR